jgi:hypothetical protein
MADIIDTCDNEPFSQRAKDDLLAARVLRNETSSMVTYSAVVLEFTCSTALQSADR